MPDEISIQDALGLIRGEKAEAEAPPSTSSGEVSIRDARNMLYGKPSPKAAPPIEGPGVLRRALTAADTALEEMHPLDYIAGQAEKAVGKVFTFDRAKLGLKEEPSKPPFMPPEMAKFYGPGASFFDWAAEETLAAKSTKDYFARVLPSSAGKLILGFGRFLSYDLPATFINPAYNYAATKMAEGISAGDAYKFAQIMSNPALLIAELKRMGDPQDAYGKFQRDLGEGIWNQVQGLAQFMGEPNPLIMSGGWKKFKKRWATDPFGSIFAIFPFVKRGYAKVTAPKPIGAEAWKKDIGLLEREDKVELDLGRMELLENLDIIKKKRLAEFEKPIAAKQAAELERPAYGETLEPKVLTPEQVAEREAGVKALEYEKSKLVQEVVEDTKERMVSLETVGGEAEKALPVMEEPPVPEAAPVPLVVQPLNKEAITPAPVEKPPKAPTEGLVDQGEGILVREKKGAWGNKRAANVVARKVGKEYESVEIEKGKWGIQKKVEEVKGFEVPAETKKMVESIREAESRELNELYEKSGAAKAKLNALQRANKVRRGKDSALIEQAAELDLEQDRMTSRILMLEKATGRKREQTVGEASRREVERKIKEKEAEETPELDPRDLTLEQANARRELFKDRPDDNPDMAIARRVAEVNAWREGAEDVNIEEVRSELDWMAENIDRLEKDYSQQEFAGVRAHAKESAAWARKQRRKGADEATSVTLMSGIDPTMLSDIGKKIRAMHEKTRELVRGTPKEIWRKGKKEAYRAWVDTHGIIRNDLFNDLKEKFPALARRTYTELCLMAGSTARAEAWNEQALKAAFGGFPGWKRDVAAEIIFGRRIMDIDSYKRDYKHPGDFKGHDHAKLIEDFKKQMSEKEFNDIEQRVKIYFDKYGELVDLLKENEFITKGKADSLKRHEYLPSKAIDAVDPIRRRNRFSTGADVHESGVEVLKKGSIDDVLMNDPELLLRDFATRTFGRIARNKATRQLVEVARDHPNGPIVRLPENVSEGEAGDWVRESYFDKGKEQTLLINREYAPEWILNESAISYGGATWLRMMSGSVILRPLAVGIEPAFVAAQAVYDVFQAWGAAQVYMDGKWERLYNPVTFPVKYGKDFKSIATDAMTSGPKTKDYVDNGGAAGFMVSGEGSMFGPHLGRKRWEITQKGLEPIFHYLGGLTRFLERAGRLAMTEQALDKIAEREKLKGGKEEARSFVDNRGERVWYREAVAVARDQMDFNRGGYMGKAVSQVVPFFGAGIQAQRSILRAMQRNKAQAAVTIGLLAAPAVALTVSNLMRAPKTMQDIDPVEEANNFINALLGDYPIIDDEGQTRYLYFKCPKVPQLRAPSTAFELITKKMYNYANPDNQVEIKTEGLASALADLTPTSTAGVPTYSAYQAIKGWNAWRSKPIWEGPRVPKELEYWKGRTPESMISLGKVIKTSPEGLNAAFDAIFTRGTYSFLGGLALDEIFSEVPKDLKHQSLWITLSQTPGIKRFIGLTHPSGHWKGATKRAEEDVTGMRHVNNQSLDFYLNAYMNEKTVGRDSIVNFFKTIKDPDEKKRLNERKRLYEKVNDFEEKDLILKFHGMAPEARARFYVNDFEKRASKQEMATFKMESRRLSKDIFNQDFWSEVAKVRRENERQSSSSSKQ